MNSEIHKYKYIGRATYSPSTCLRLSRNTRDLKDKNTSLGCHEKTDFEGSFKSSKDI